MVVFLNYSEFLLSFVRICLYLYIWREGKRQGGGGREKERGGCKEIGRERGRER